MKKALLCGIALLVAPSPMAAQTPSIEHSAVACVVAEKFPRMEARFTPAESVAVARIVFQGENIKEWYSVAMKPEGLAFFGVLPTPKKSLKSFRYYIEVTDKTMGSSRTSENVTSVVDSAGACKGRLLAASLASASVLIQGPAGALALPAGFASAGVVAGAAAGSGSAVGTAGAGVGAGGGIGATALVIGGIAAAGGAVALALPKGDSSSDSSSTSGTSGSSKTIYGVSFPGMIDVSVCAGHQLLWSSHNVSADAGGSFNETWSVNEPNTMRVTGQVTPTTFQATITCINGARSGSISASGSNGSYNGSFSFGGTGPVAVVKQ